MSTTVKPWGTTFPIIRTDEIHVERLRVVSGGYCSIHRHLNKTNTFHVLSGALLVVEFDERGNLKKHVQLLAGRSTFVDAGVWHMFWGWAAAEVIETYCPDKSNGPVDDGDIDRLEALAIGGIEPDYFAMKRRFQKAFNLV